MRTPGQQGDFHVGQRRAGQHAQMGLFRQMGQHQPLPVEVKRIGRTRAGKLHARAALRRLDEQMHLRIMPQWLKMPDADHGGRDRLLVDNAAFIKCHIHAKAFCNQAGQNLKLYFTHELQMDLAQAFVPYHAQLRVLFLQLAKVLQHDMGITALGQDDPVTQHRFEHGRHRARFPAQPHAGPGVCQAGDSADHAALGPFDRLVFLAGVDTDLVYLFLPAAVLFPFQLCAHSKAAARDLEIGQAVALPVACDLEYPRAERCIIFRRAGIPVDPIQQLLHALQLERRAEITGEHFAGMNQRSDLTVLYLSGFQKSFQQCLIAHGDLFCHAVRRAEVHAAGIQPGL